MSPVQGKSPPVQVKEPYGNLDMVTCRLSSCNPECTKVHLPIILERGLAVYRERKKEVTLCFWAIWFVLCLVLDGKTFQHN